MAATTAKHKTPPPPPTYSIQDIGRMLFDINIRCTARDEELLKQELELEAFARRQHAFNKRLGETLAKLAASFKTTKELPDPPAAATTKRGWQLPPSLTQAPHSVAQETWPRLRFIPPRFEGEKVVEWIHNIQIYYNHSYTPLSDRLYLTKYLFDHPASDWMTDWTGNNAGKGWDDFLFAVKQRFDPEPYADYAGPVRKPHNSSSDLLAWSEAPSPAVSSTANAVRANQPVDGVCKVPLDGKTTEENAAQITEETAGILNKRKPCSGYKPKAMNDSGEGSTGSGAYDDSFKCRTSVCIVQRAPITAGDSSIPRLLEKEKFACFDDTSDAGPKPLFSDGRKSCLEPNTLLGVGNQDVFRQEQTLASDARSIPPRKDVTHSGGSLSSSLRQTESSTMLEVEKGMLDIGELNERIDTLPISPFLPLTPVVENSLWGYGPLQAAHAYLHNFSFRELMGDDRRVHSFVQGVSFVVKFSNKKFIDREQICGYIAFFPKVEPLIAGEQFLIASYYDRVVPFRLLFFALGVPNDRVMTRRLAPDIIGAAGGIFYLEWNASVGVLEDESNGHGGEGHTRGDSDSEAGHLDLCGDTRTLPPRETRHHRAIPICFQTVANQSQREMLLSQLSAIGVNGVAQVPFQFNTNEDITQSNSVNICKDQINLEEFNGGDRSNNKYKLAVNAAKFSKTSDPKHAVLVRTVNACGGSKRLASLRTLLGHMRCHSIKKKGMSLFKECDRRFETMRAMFGDIKSYSQRMMKVSSIVEPGVNGSHCDVSKLDEVKGIAAAADVYEVVRAATRVFEEFVLNEVDEAGHTLYFRLRMLHISDNLRLSDRLLDKKYNAGVLLQLPLLSQNQWLKRLATFVATLRLSIFVIELPQVQWLMHHFPNLRLEDKAIFIGGGVDRDSNITTAHHYHPTCYVDETPKK